MRIQVFIDSEGRKRSVQAVLSDWQSIAARTDSELLRYLVNTAGYVLIDQDQRRLHSSIDYRSASDEAITALIYENFDHEQFSSRPLFTIESGKIVQTFDCAGSAVRQIIDRWERRQSRTIHRAHRRRVPLSGVTRAPFRQLLIRCTTTRSRDLKQILQLVRTHFNDRYLIVRPNPDSGRLILTHIGEGYSHIDARWRRRNLGGLFGEFENKSYSEFVKQAYREAWTQQVPVLEEIDAPRPTDPPNEWISYDRMLVPISTDDGPAMLSATLMRS